MGVQFHYSIQAYTFMTLSFKIILLEYREALFITLATYKGMFSSCKMSALTQIRHAGLDGGGLYCGSNNGVSNSVQALLVRVKSNFNFAERNGGFACLARCNTSMLYRFNATFNKATFGGAIYATESLLTLEPDSSYMYLTHNTAKGSGGALFLQGSAIALLDGLVVVFERNVVTAVDGKGGAIFYQDGNCTQVDCFYYYGDVSKKLIFLENKAQQGSVLYGGLLDRCINPIHNNLTGIKAFKRISSFEPSPLAITSQCVYAIIHSQTALQEK